MSKLVDEYNFSEKLNNTKTVKYCNEKASEFGEHLSSNTYIRYIIVRVQPYSNALENRVTPLRGFRWLLALSYLGLFLYNIIITQGFYLLAYFEGIYLLGLFNTYVPQFKPEAEVKDLESQTDVESAQLLTTEEGEVNTPAKPKLNEYKIWKRTMISTLICQLLTNVDFLNVPIFWPILFILFSYLTIASVLKRVKCPTLVNKIIVTLFTITDSLLILGAFVIQASLIYDLLATASRGDVTIY
ncbi:hypothetical protein CONCODRAFT_20565 [Conidiobolus coronatus NRRL 28638]|uniref:Protein RER1 n=1 Tax=Conidiobolus coronatus (strain ATCC 28846 / CBS 209.66 / NRRL 28638) TaxID=796925 RepID=A0A137NSP4_CONC2|nr:hypothetical protein CONCODRAFT_20565 [Conidiobolus coronatus NRRL 28638]|eukprot:KXN65785.1 hypothetical protein CONCODRAFT_20565 [Conidiobolus coronatus NRRL 28638]